MRRIVIINIKGGCGKTTIATNLASFYASKGKNTALYDYDAQGSSMRWMQVRDQEQDVAEIYGVTAYSNSRGVTKSWQLRLPPETERIIVDTPPGLRWPDLVGQLKGADTILIPVLPSSIDVYATADFIRDLMLGSLLRKNKTRIAIIANRVRKNTKSVEMLKRFLDSLNIPVVAELRDTQNYVRATEVGLGVHELKRQLTQEEKEHWNTLYNWLEDIE